MLEGSKPQEAYDNLKRFFERAVCQQGTKPLRKGIQIAIKIGEAGPFTLTKEKNLALILPDAPQKPDMSFQVPPKALKQLLELQTEDLGEVGIAIIKLMAHSDPELKMQTSVHIGLVGLLRNGYLGVIPMGGTKVMKFLASKGFSNIGKIKDAILRLRS